MPRRGATCCASMAPSWCCTAITSEASLHWLPGREHRIPVIGVPSASGAPEGGHEEPSGYNLYEIEGASGAWRCTMISRGWRDGSFGRDRPAGAV